MLPSDIIILEDIINNKTQAEIEARLYTIPPQLRHEEDQSHKAALTQEMQRLACARDFKKWLTENAALEIPLNSTLLQLSHFFIAQTRTEGCPQAEIENFHHLALHCLSNFFDNMLPEIEPSDIIALGKAFIDEPLHFAGFLFWLIENRASFEEIGSSGVLHQYFAYHAFELDVIGATYNYLYNASTIATEFLAYFQEISCHMRGFINQNAGPDGYLSYNVLGAQFQHETQHNPSNNGLLSSTHKLSTYDDLSENSITLYTLFGWSLIDALHLDNMFHQKIIVTILTSNKAEGFLFEFSARALSGELDKNHAFQVIRLVRNNFWDSISDDEEKHALLERNPFLIHTYSGNSDFNEQVALTIPKLNTPTYLNVQHIHFLASLFKKLPRSIFFDRKHADALLELIFSIILPIGNSLTDELSAPIEAVSDDLMPLFRRFLSDCNTTLQKTINDFILEESDFSAVESAWSKNLSMINLIFYLKPTLGRNPDYPHGKYALYTAVIDQIAALSDETQLTERLRHFLSAISHTIGLPRITLLEALQRTTNQHTRDLILKFSVFESGFVDFVMQPGLNGKTVVETALTKNKKELFLWIYEVASRSGTLFALYEYITQFLQNLTQRFDDDLSQTFNDNHWPAISLILHANGISHPPIRQIIKKLFAEAVENGAVLFINFLLQHDSLQPITKSDVRALLLSKSSFEHHHHEVALMLCGMRTEPRCRQAILRNNTPLYLAFILKSIAHKKNLRANLAAFPQAQSDFDDSPFFNSNLRCPYDKGQNILHLAAANRHLPTLKTVFEAIETQDDSEEILAMLNERDTNEQIPRAIGDSPAARAINAFLAEKRSQYYSKVYGSPPTSARLAEHNRIFPTAPASRKRPRYDNELSETVRIDYSDDDRTSDETNDSGETRSTIRLLNMQF